MVTEATGGVGRGQALWNMPPCSLELDCIFLDVQFLASGPSLCLELVHSLPVRRMYLFVEKMCLLVSDAPTAPCSVFYTTEVLNKYF